MLTKAISVLTPKLEVLSWFDKYAGLTRIVKNDSNEAYPMSCEIDSTNCFRNDDHKRLVPDSNKKSIMYWQQVGGIKTTDLDRPRNAINQHVILDLVIWLNLKALGKTDSDFVDEVYNDLLKVLHGEHSTDINEFSLSGKINSKISYNRDTDQTRSDIFNKYAYGSEEILFNYPYAVTSFRISMDWMTRRDCLELSTIGAAIEC